MKKFLLSALLIAIAGLYSCKKHDKNNTVQDPIPENPTQLTEIHGSWTWLRSTGAPGVADELPSDSLSRSVTFDANDNVAFYQNGGITNQYKYYVTGTQSPYKIEFFLDGANVAEYKTEFLHKDTISMTDQHVTTEHNLHYYVRD